MARTKDGFIPRSFRLSDENFKQLQQMYIQRLSTDKHTSPSHILREAITFYWEHYESKAK